MSAIPGESRLAEVSAHLDQIGVRYGRSEDETVLSATFQLEQTVVEAGWMSHRAGSIVELDLVYPFLVPRGRLAAVAVAIADANLSLRHGRLDLDTANQRLLYRSFHTAMDQPVTRNQVVFHLQTGLAIVDLLAVPLQEVCFRGATSTLPRDLIRAISLGVLTPDGDE
jgi:hypothetical protein